MKKEKYQFISSWFRSCKTIFFTIWQIFNQPQIRNQCMESNEISDGILHLCKKSTKEISSTSVLGGCHLIFKLDDLAWNAPLTIFSKTYSSIHSCPTSGGAVLRSKLVDGMCRVQFPVALVDLAVRSFPWFSPKLT